MFILLGNTQGKSIVWYTGYMCDCRVCKLEFMYPTEIDKIVSDVFDYLIDDK